MAETLPGTSALKSQPDVVSEVSQQEFPKKWIQVGVVEKLFIYPVEGSHPKEILQGTCTPRGLAEPLDLDRHSFLDRSFVIYNEKDKICKTLEDYSHLVCFKMSSTKRGTFRFHQLDESDPKNYHLPDDQTAPKVKVVYHGKDIEVYDCGEEVAQDISAFLLHKTKGIRLGMHCHLNRRDISDSMLEKSTINLKSAKAKKMHADFSSYLIIAQPSIDNVLYTINNTSIGTENFRPNIVLNGSQLTDFPEDRWNWIKINNVIFNNTRLCSHTDTTTISIRTGIKSFRDEPIRNMKPKRMLANVINIPQEEDIAVLGINAETNNTGIISIGDGVYVGTS